MNNPTAPCDNRPDAACSFYPDSWSDADIDAYELQRELDDVTWCNQEDAIQAAAQLNHLNRIDNAPDQVQP